LRSAPQAQAKALECIRATIEDMALALFAMHVLETMFFAGLAGSALVVIISFVEDGKELFVEDE
jgi:hypothetical protein